MARISKVMGFLKEKKNEGDSVSKENPFLTSWSCDMWDVREKKSAAACKIYRGLAKSQLRQNLVQVKERLQM